MQLALFVKGMKEHGSCGGHSAWLCRVGAQVELWLHGQKEDGG